MMPPLHAVNLDIIMQSELFRATLLLMGMGKYGWIMWAVMEMNEA